MSRYLKNGLAYIRGMIYSLMSIMSRERKIEEKVRIFLSASLNLDKKSNIHIGHNAKIRERAMVSVRKGAYLDIGKDVSIGMDCKVVAHEKIIIGKGTLLSPNVLIYDHDHVFDVNSGVHRKDFKTKPVIIGSNCWIGANTVILKGVVIGDNCVVGAGSVVNSNIPTGMVLVQKRVCELKQR